MKNACRLAVLEWGNQLHAALVGVVLHLLYITFYLAAREGLKGNTTEQCFSTRVPSGFSQGAKSTGPGLPWISIISCRGFARPVANPIIAKDALWPGRIAPFFAIVEAVSSSTSWQQKVEVLLLQISSTSCPLSYCWNLEVGL